MKRLITILIVVGLTAYFFTAAMGAVESYQTSLIHYHMVIGQ